MRLRILTAPPNYGRTTVGRTTNNFGRLVGGEPRDRRGARSNGIRVRGKG